MVHMVKWSIEKPLLTVYSSSKNWEGRKSIWVSVSLINELKRGHKTVKIKYKKYNFKKLIWLEETIFFLHWETQFSWFNSEIMVEGRHKKKKNAKLRVRVLFYVNCLRIIINDSRKGSICLYIFRTTTWQPITLQKRY